MHQSLPSGLTENGIEVEISTLISLLNPIKIELMRDQCLSAGLL